MNQRTKIHCLYLQSLINLTSRIKVAVEMLNFQNYKIKDMKAISSMYVAQRHGKSTMAQSIYELKQIRNSFVVLIHNDRHIATPDVGQC
mmetsp:Transcript_32213/g.44935  ORF Transcript_32213/g.44935 Transcript_32213/m.44935 type:complete len:89 (-) Transcript_32213:280-546(-)